MVTLNNSDEWVYFNKGNANILFSYNGSNSQYKDKLLRLRMSNQTITSVEIYSFLETLRSRIPDCIGAQLVKVGFNKLGCLNEGYGLLLTNLTADATLIKKDKYFKIFQSHQKFIIEMKPKWLIDTVYGCRNCANHSMKHGGTSEFCSKLLLDPSQRTKMISLLIDDSTAAGILEEYLSKSDNVLSRIRDLQERINFEALKEKDDVNEDICFQMTLRDVTVFIEIDQKTKGVKSTVTDLDYKSNSKWAQWVEKEQELFDFYGQSDLHS